MSSKKNSKGKQSADKPIEPEPLQTEDGVQTRAARAVPDKPTKSPAIQTTLSAILGDQGKDELFSFITDSLKEQTSQIVGRIDLINNEIVDLHTKTSNILASVTYNAEQIESNTDEIKTLKDEMTDAIESLEKRLLTQEMYSRKNNLLVYGISDDTDPMEGVKDLFTLIGVPNVENMLFVNIHRLPRHSTDPKNFRADMPKPIVVKFVRTNDRQSVLDASFKAWSKLKQGRVSIRTDLPVPLKKLRGRLANRAFELRKSQKIQTKILERGIQITLQVRKTSQDQWKTIGIDENPQNIL